MTGAQYSLQWNDITIYLCSLCGFNAKGLWLWTYLDSLLCMTYMDIIVPNVNYTAKCVVVSNIA